MGIAGQIKQLPCQQYSVIRASDAGIQFGMGVETLAIIAGMANN